MHIQAIQTHRDDPPVVLVLGTGDIASAIGRLLFASGWGVVMLRDTAGPVLRRGMAFDDALEDGFAELDGIWGVRASAPDALSTLALAREGIVVANLDLAVVAATCPAMASVLIDARMRKYATSADLRPLAACAIGVGPGFVAEENVDMAVETLPGREGALVPFGPTATPTGRTVALGGAGSERFLYADAAGPWLPRVELGAIVEVGAAIGELGERPVHASIEGCVRGMVRATPSGVARGSKLAEIDPRPGAPWRGVPPRAARIAAGVCTALAPLMPLAVDCAGA